MIAAEPLTTIRSAGRHDSITVLVADSQPLFRDSLARLVRQRAHLELVAELADGRAALDAILSLRPDVALLDLALAGLEPSAITAARSQAGGSTGVVVLGHVVSSEEAYRLMAAGVRGVLSRSITVDELERAIARVACGETAIGAEAQAGIASAIQLRARGEHTPFTTREREVLALIAEGRTAREIGAELHLSTATVKTHMVHLYDKLGVSERAAAVAQAMRRGLLV